MLRFENGGRYLALAVLLPAIFLRAPHLLLQPRFWAEEGAWFYAVALRSSILEGLLFVPRGTAGYYLLSATLPTTFAANALPLEAGPWVTTLAAFAVLLVALVIILFGRSLVWTTPSRRLVACAVVLFAPSAVGEVWLNSTNSQVYCGLIALCILCEDLENASRRRIAIYTVLVALCGLSGVYTAFLFPAFAYRWLWHRSLAVGALALTVAATAATQVAVFATLLSEQAIHDSKFVQLDLVRSVSFLIFGQVARPLGAEGMAREAAYRLGIQPGAIDPGPAAVVLLVLAIVAAVGLVWLLLERRLRSPRNLLALAYATLAGLTTLSAKLGVASGRYAVLSGFALLYLLLAGTGGDASGRWGRLRQLVAGLLLALSLAVGFYGYRNDEAFRCYGPCPVWPEELAYWRQDPSYMPRVWPTRLPPSSPQWRVPMPPPDQVR